MLGRLFRRSEGRSGGFQAPIQLERPVYAIGDVHGRADLLAKLMEDVLRDGLRCDTKPLIVFLGDYIDRGEASRETIEFLMAIAGWEEVECVFLMGNHEAMLLDFLEVPKRGERWMRFGGLQTLASYGVGGFRNLTHETELARVRDALFSAMGPHLEFLGDLRSCHLVGNVFFAHAGADPVVPIPEQDRQVMLWGCDTFLEQRRRDGTWVVYGHYISDTPVVASGRIGIDTGAYFSDRLTAVRLDEQPPRFMAT
ncbi:MAG: metallophosphoesterase [Pseudomonadota bacterium]